MKRTRKKNIEGEFLFIGIDPGDKGAIAIINEYGNIFKLEDYIGEVHSADLIRALPNDKQKIAFIEKVGAASGWQASSSNKLIDNFATWKGIFLALQIPLRTVKPREWQKGVIANKKIKKKKGETDKQKRARLTREKKEIKKRSVEAACRLFPDGNFYGKRGGLKDGRSDAALIADCGRKMYIKH